VEVVDEGGPAVAGNYPNGQYGALRFHHLFMNGPDVPGEQPKSKAQAFYPNTNGNHAADVYFDNGDPWSVVGSLSMPDVLGAAVHEIGHTLGLGHTSVSDANMYWIFRRTAGLGTAALHPDDIAGVRAIYGNGVGGVTSLVRVPEPPISASAVLALGCLGVRIRARAATPRRRRG
jgi:hypothetical protein